MQRVIFTGQSGINVEDAIRGLFIGHEPHFARSAKKPAFFKIESRMKQAFLAQEDLADGGRVWMEDILTLPYSRLQEMWKVSLSKILEEDIPAEGPGKDIFLNFHACFYHQETVEYFSCACEKLIRKFNPTLFVTLIDDIYDIHSRLRAPEQLFNIEHGASPKPEALVFELLRLLDWRAAEIMMTRHLAEQLDVPHYVFAVKHPAQTLYKLIYEKKSKPTCYASHPITEVRRLERVGKNQEAQVLINEIDRFQAAIANDFTCFMPTTIDELRIDYQERDQGRLFRPRLTKRWDETKYRNPVGSLFIVPSESASTNPLWESNIESDTLSLLLEALHKRIEVQVSSRDHKLVEQSDFIAVYRPCFNGNASSGVLQEIRYHLEKPVKNCFIYLPVKDQNELKIMILRGTLQDKICAGALAYGAKPNSEVFQLSSTEREKVLTAEWKVDALMPVLGQILNNHKLSMQGVERKGVQGDTVLNAKNWKKVLLDEVCGDFNRQIAEYKTSANYTWEKDDLTPEGFVDEIVKYLIKQKK